MFHHDRHARMCKLLCMRTSRQSTLPQIVNASTLCLLCMEFSSYDRHVFVKKQCSVELWKLRIGDEICLCKKKLELSILGSNSGGQR